MITLIVILAYIANIFLNRWLNKLMFKRGYMVYPIMWFLSLFTTGIMVIILLGDYIENDMDSQTNWFTGKYWKK